MASEWSFGNLKFVFAYRVAPRVSIAHYSSAYLITNLTVFISLRKVEQYYHFYLNHSMP